MKLASPLIFAAVLASHPVYAAEADRDPCPPAFQREQQRGMLVGRGSGSTYEEAKSAAIADAVSTLGLKIAATSTLERDGRSASLSKTIVTEVTRMVKGFEVLSECTTRAGEHQVVGGISKSRLASLIEQHQQQRLAQASVLLAFAKAADKDTPLSTLGRQFADLLAAEREDLDAWLILGKPRQIFLAIAQEDKEQFAAILRQKSAVRRALLISADDKLAKATFPTLLERLHADGISASLSAPGAAAVTWQCTVRQGLPTGIAVRYTARCVLRGANAVDLQPIAVTGMATAEAVDDQAARLVEEKLASQ